MSNGEFDISKPKVKEVSADEILAYIQNNLIRTHHRFGFRGQRSAEWQLRPTMARFLEELKADGKVDNSTTYEDIQPKVFRTFRENVLLNQDLTPEQVKHVDLWQYGQHYGLPTPMLDWTYSPYVGLFFALSSEGVAQTKENSDSRSIWILDIDLLQQINDQIVNDIRPRLGRNIQSQRLLEQQVPLMEPIAVVDGYNRRMGYQQGFFTKHVFYDSFEVWARRIASEMTHACWGVPLLKKVTFAPTKAQLSNILCTLDKMNINSRTLFPDIKGSVEYTCFKLKHTQFKRNLNFSASS